MSSGEANTAHRQASSSSDGNGSGRAQYAVYCNVTDELKVMGLHEEVPVSVPGEQYNAMRIIAFSLELYSSFGEGMILQATAPICF